MCVVAMSLFFQSCLNDSLNDCDPLIPTPPPTFGDTIKKMRVFFDYEEETSANYVDLGIRKGIRRGDLESVSQLDLYIFDATGLYIDKYTDRQPYLRQKDTYCIEFELPVGNYMFVAWGGLQKIDFAVTPASPIRRISRFNDFSVNYRFEGDTIVSQVENLYYGMMENVAVGLSDSLRIRLRQDTYIFNIKLCGSAVRQSPSIGVSEIFESLITDNNSYYNFRNEPVNAPTHIYKTGFNPNAEHTEWEASRTTLLVRSDRKPILRFFRNGKAWKVKGMEGIDLVKVLQDYASERRILLDFTAMYEFNLTFTIDGDPDDESSLSVGVSIGDWAQTLSDNELYM
jgi:hypothetical protein